MTNKQIYFIYFLSIITLSKNLFSSFNFASKDAAINITKTNSIFTINSAITGYNGTLNLKDNTASTIANGMGETLTFSSGILQTGAVVANLSGEFDPTGTDTITLDTGNVLDVASGTIVQTVAVANDADAATILGQPLFSSAIALGNASSKLNLGITTELNQSITGAGTVTLLNDLTLASGVQLPSIIDLNGKKLHMTGGSVNSAWGDATTVGGVVEIHSQLTLNSTITLGAGGAIDYTISGNGNILDLGGMGGAIELQNAGSTLTFSNLIIKGLEGVDAAARLRGAGTMIFSDCTLVLSGNYQRNDGSFVFSGDPCKVITNGSTFIVDDTNNVMGGIDLNVDGMVLEYEQLDGSETLPFSATNGATITESNGGSIRSTSAGGTSNLVVDVNMYTFTNNFFLTSSSSIEFNNDTVISDKNIDVNGNGHAIYFPKKSGTYITVDENVDLRFESIALKDFNHANITLAPATFGSAATVSFGDNCLIEMNQDLTIESGDYAWIIRESCVVDGNGHTLRIEKASGIDILSGMGTPTFKNVKFELSEATAIASSASGNVIFQDCTFVLLHGMGTNFIPDPIAPSFKGKNYVTSGSSKTLEFSSSGNLSILADSELIFEPNTTFKYDPVKASGPVDPDADKEHLVIDAAGTIEFNGSKLEADGVGIEFQTGTVRIKDAVTFQTTATFDIEVDAAVNFNFSSGAVLDVDGPLKYIP